VCAEACWPIQQERVAKLASVCALLNDVVEDLPHNAVAPICDLARMREAVAAFDFDAPADPLTVTRRVVELLRNGIVHTMHPGHFGLYNPTSTFPGIVADLVTAHLNPQLAVWSHAPAPVEIERRVVAEIAALFGDGQGRMNPELLRASIESDMGGRASPGIHRSDCRYDQRRDD